MANVRNDDFQVYMYANEVAFLKWLVLNKKNIETGGDLFGLWQNKSTAVVQLILGPGQNCSRTRVSFHQDVNYLKHTGEYLTTKQGICNIGEWHSHHQIGLTTPSGGDKNTVRSHLPTVSGGRFLLFIANIKKDLSVKIGCFMFDIEQPQKMKCGELVELQDGSPIRHEVSVSRGAETNQDWETFCSSNVQATLDENERCSEDVCHSQCSCQSCLFAFRIWIRQCWKQCCNLATELVQCCRNCIICCIEPIYKCCLRKSYKNFP